MKLKLILLIILLPILSFTQTLNIGVGLTSRGSTCAKFAVTDINKFGVYTKFVNDELACTDNAGDAGLVGICYDEFTIGASYLVHDDVNILLGIGKSKKETYNNPFEMVRDYSIERSTIYEIGFSYRLIQYNKLRVSVDATISNYSGVSTLCVIGYSFNNCK